MSKNKMWKAEKQEDLAFYAESERIKLLLACTLNKINAALCCVNSFNMLEHLKLEMHCKDQILLTKFADICCSSSVSDVDLEKGCTRNIGISTNRMIQDLSVQTVQSIIDTFQINNFEKATLFYKTLGGLFTAFGYRLSMNADNTKMHKKRLRRAWKEQQRYKEEIRGLRNELYGLQMAAKARIAAKRRHIRHQEQQIVDIRKNCKEEIAKLCADSEQHMEESCTTSQDHQEELQRELYGAECTLQDLISSHQLVEASLRSNKKRAEETLQLVIAEFDATMFKLHAEVEGTQDGYLDELQQLHTLQAKFEHQEVLYIAAMQDKRREEMEELEKKMLLFRRRMAVYKIQRFWRAYQIRKQASKGKKGKKGRKKQAASEKKK